MIEQVQNGDSGLTVRTAINQAIDRVNSSGVQLLASASVDLNLADVPLTHPIMGNSTFASTSNAKLTYTSGTGPFTIGEYVTDDNGGVATVFYDSTSTMSIAYIQSAGHFTAPFTPGLGFTGSISANTATIVTAVSGNLLTPGESIVSVNLSSSATVVTSQSGSYLYGAYSELSSVTGDFKVSYLTLGALLLMNPWQPGETINDSTSGASATFIYQNPVDSTLIVRNVSGTFSNGDTIVGSLSGNESTLNDDLIVGYNYNVVVGQTSKVAFPIDIYTTSSHADTTITLSGGSKFVVTDMVMTNGVGTFVSASAGPYLFTAPSQGGNLIAQGTIDVSDFRGSSPGAIRVVLTSPSNYVNNIGYVNNYIASQDIHSTSILPGIALPSNITVGSTLYYSNVPNTSTATADVYVYGYILS